MTGTDEARFIQLYQEGASYQAIAQAMPCAIGTRAVSTWSPTLQRWDTTVRPPAGSGGTHGGGMARKTWGVAS
jgi:hypothetical protein